MSGHVFIVRGDLRRLACDAWLMPCSRNARPLGTWFLRDDDGPRSSEPFTEGGPRVQPLGDAVPGQPRRWLTRVGRSGQAVAWLGPAGEIRAAVLFRLWSENGFGLITVGGPSLGQCQQIASAWASGRLSAPLWLFFAALLVWHVVRDRRRVARPADSEKLCD